MPVTFRDTADIERASGMSADGTPSDFTAVASGVLASVWETLKKVEVAEGDVWFATAEALLASGTDVQRRDVLVTRGRRLEVLQVFPARHISGGEKFVHVVLREQTARPGAL